MEYAYFNPNPAQRNVGDCTVRAISKAMDQSWETSYLGIAMEGLLLFDMPSANHVWGEYLKRKGFHRELAPDGITVREFANEHPNGTYILALSGHVVCIKNGTLFDSWDSSNEIVLYFWERE